MNNKTSQSGFTLIELIAVMVILGILAAVIVPRLTTMTSGAYESNVRNMYGLIKNEVTAQATKAAMSGDYLETFPEPGAECIGCPTTAVMEAEDYYLKTWVGDYDPSQWSSFVFVDKYDNSTNDVSTDPHENTNAVLFMYHPHGKPNAAVTWEGAAGFDNTPPTLTAADGGNTPNKEDIYWIYYAPRTSPNGNDRGRDLDGYVMGAWKNMALDFDFDGVIDSDGTITDAGDDPLTDLWTLYEPN